LGTGYLFKKDSTPRNEQVFTYCTFKFHPAGGGGIY
jgi:hypothetical protein